MNHKLTPEAIELAEKYGQEFGNLVAKRAEISAGEKLNADTSHVKEAVFDLLHPKNFIELTAQASGWTESKAVI